MFVLINESVHLTPVTPPKSPFEVSACKMVGCTPMSELQLPFFSGELVLLMLDVVKCHGSARDACPQGQPGVAGPSDTSAKNIGRKECRESRRKYVDWSDGSGREY